MKKVFQGKKILITGHTGFKGSWLTAFLYNFNAKILGISLPGESNGQFKFFKKIKIFKDSRFDICDYRKLEKTIKNFKPDFIFHLAAQSLVIKSIQDPVQTWKSNLIGTLNILNCLRELKHNCTAILITSDKCYKNKEILRGYKEADELGGSDPYSASKASAEICINSFFQTYLKNKTNIKIASCRAGNVIGGGDWSENRIIPDFIKAWKKNEPLIVRNPNSTRPWQFVLEPLYGYMLLAKNLKFNRKINGQSFNFGPKAKKHINVRELISIMTNYINFSKIKFSRNNKNSKESALLQLNSKKAKKNLTWETKLDINLTLNLISGWYEKFFTQKKNVDSITLSQIKFYINKLNAKSRKN